MSNRQMRLGYDIVVGMLLVLCAGCADRAIETKELMTIDWKEMQEKGYLKGNEVAADETGHAHPLKIVSPLREAGNGMPAMVPVAEIPVPPISKQVFMLSGQVRYENVQGTGFMEMWSLFPDGSHYFTRTLGGIGPMGQLTGSSGWREIRIPFQVSNSARPNKLVLNAGFQGAGTVWLSGLKLIETDELIVSSQGRGWWSDRTAGLIGAVGGTLLGILGGVIGWLARKKKTSPLVRPLAVAVMVMGGLFVTAGISAIALQQPYGVYYPLLMLGGFSIFGGGMLFVRYQSYCADLELRRMEAMDLEG